MPLPTRSAPLGPLALGLALALACAAPAAALAATQGTARTAAQGTAQTAALPERIGAVTLKRPAQVIGEVVTLGDLFAGLGAEQAGTPVARAPKLGESVPVDAAWLGRLAEHYKVDWAPRSHLDGTVVEHAATHIGVAEIEAEVSRLLEEQSAGARLEVTLDNPALSVALPLESGGRFGLEGLRQDPRSGRFTVALVYPASGTPTIRTPVSGRVAELVEVPVLLRRVAADEIIGADDVGWELRRADRLAGNLVTDPAQIVGQSPKRSLRAGDPVRGADLRMPVLVPRNSLVTLRLKVANMTLTAQGRALDEGGLGSVVRVVNLKSNTVVQAVVSEAGVVDVASAAAALSN